MDLDKITSNALTYLIDREHGDIGMDVFVSQCQANLRRDISKALVSSLSVRDLRFKRPFERLSTVSGLEVDPTENRYLIASATDGKFLIYDTHSPSSSDWTSLVPPDSSWKSQKRHIGGISSIQWYPVDTGAFLTSGDDGTVKLWDTNALDVVCSFDKTKSIEKAFQARMSHTGTHTIVAVASSDSDVLLCDPRTGCYTQRLAGHCQSIRTVEWSPSDANTLISGSSDFSVRIWDVRRSSSLMVLDQHNDILPSLDLFQRKNDPRKASENVRSHDGVLKHVAFTSTGREILSLGSDSTIRQWETYTGQCNKVFYQTLYQTARGYRHGDISRFSLSSDGYFLFYPCGKDVLVFDALKGNRIAHLKGLLSCTNTVFAFQEISSTLFAGDDKGCISAWSCDMEEMCTISQQDTFGNLENDWDSGSD